jgi:hypothetical protein
MMDNDQNIRRLAFKMILNLIFTIAVVCLAGCKAMVGKIGNMRYPTSAEQEEIERESQAGQMRDIR